MNTMMCRRNRLPLAAALLLLTGFARAEDIPPPDGAFAEHMHGHLVHVDAIKDAVIAGQLDATREHSVWLSEHDEPPGMPDAWAPYVNEMRQYAAVAAAARDLHAVAVAVSEIARTCGECHRANMGQPRFDIDDRPPETSEDVTAQMQRHLWAADRMWQSLITPSDEFWTWGTDMLAEVHLTPAQIGGTRDEAARVEQLLEQVRTLGEQGRSMRAGPARSELLGEFMSLCADCHELTGGGPAARAAGPGPE